MMQPGLALHWFRNDLRLDDNPALQAALDHGYVPIPVYIHAPDEGGEWRPGSGSWDIIDFNPYDDAKLASITIATVDEVDEAYRAAQTAQKE